MRVNNTPLFFKSHYFIYKIPGRARRGIFTGQATIISCPCSSRPRGKKAIHPEIYVRMHTLCFARSIARLSRILLVFRVEVSVPAQKLAHEKSDALSRSDY